MCQLLLSMLLCVIKVGCSQSPVEETSTNESLSPIRLTAVHLSNLVKLHPKMISGSLPQGDAAFQELHRLGVKTIISVDAGKPDIKTAAKFGLRYVHLPHGYDGIPEARVKELAKAVRDLESPIYIHCHHGKHRSPAAASVACVSTGIFRQSDALAVLTIAGTSPDYRGLYDSVRNARPLEEVLLDELHVQYREIVEVPPMAEAMVAIERTHDHLKAIEAAGWRSPKEHPDLDPAHEALLLREYFTELLRVESEWQQVDGFNQLLRDSVESAQLLEEALRGQQLAATETQPPATYSGLASRVESNCKACHQQFRDVPLGEK